MKILNLILLLFLACISILSQPYSREVKGYVEKEELLEVEVTDGRIILHPRSEKIMEVRFYTPGQEKMDSSYAVVITGNQVQTTFTDHSEKLIYSTGLITAIVYKSPFQIKFEYKGNLLTGEQEGYFRNDSLSGFRFYLQPKESIYGGGLRALGMDRRGNRLELYNKPSYGFETHADLMYYSMPVVVSSRGYMILFDNVPKGFLDIGFTEANILSFESTGGRSAYQIIAGDNYYDLISQYTMLTGRQPLPPRWVLGNFSSRFGYHSEKETKRTIRKFHRYKIPVDAVVIDIYWFGKDIQGHMGNLDWDRTYWPEPEKMMSYFRNRGVKTLLVTEPFVLTTSKNWEEVCSKGLLVTDSTGNPYIYDFYFGETGLLDIFKPETKQWFWDIYKAHTLSGVDGWWGDLGEPEWHPQQIVHVNGAADEVHNVYGHEWAKIVYDGYRADFPERRPFTLMRAGYAGSQRFGMISWSGDVNRTWGGLKSQPEIALQMGIQGLAYAHSDLGGFAGDYKDKELYLRWLQFGLFQPVFRPHAQEEVPSEPVFWDRKTRRLATESILMRYRMLPYNYTLAFENSIKGYPLMRPLFYEYPEVESSFTDPDLFLWGDALLVHPILEKGVDTVHINLPEGNTWTDFYSGKQYRGGESVTLTPAKAHIPVFARGGAFIPLIGKEISSTDYYNTSELEIHFFADPGITDSEGYLYDDDGESYNSYEREKYEILRYEYHLGNRGTEFLFTREGGDYKGRPLERNIELIIYNPANIPEKVMLMDSEIEVGKKQVSVSSEGNLRISFVWDGSPVNVSY